MSLLEFRITNIEKEIWFPASAASDKVLQVTCSWSGLRALTSYAITDRPVTCIAGIVLSTCVNPGETVSGGRWGFLRRTDVTLV